MRTSPLVVGVKSMPHTETLICLELKKCHQQFESHAGLVLTVLTTWMNVSPK